MLSSFQKLLVNHRWACFVAYMVAYYSICTPIILVLNEPAFADWGAVVSLLLIVGAALPYGAVLRWAQISQLPADWKQRIRFSESPLWRIRVYSKARRRPQSMHLVITDSHLHLMPNSYLFWPILSFFEQAIPLSQIVEVVPYEGEVEIWYAGYGGHIYVFRWPSNHVDEICDLLPERTFQRQSPSTITIYQFPAVQWGFLIATCAAGGMLLYGLFLVISAGPQAPAPQHAYAMIGYGAIGVVTFGSFYAYSKFSGAVAAKESTGS